MPAMPPLMILGKRENCCLAWDTVPTELVEDEVAKEVVGEDILLAALTAETLKGDGVVGPLLEACVVEEVSLDFISRQSALEPV